MLAWPLYTHTESFIARESAMQCMHDRICRVQLPAAAIYIYETAANYTDWA